MLWSPDASQPGGYTQNTTFSPSQQGLYDASTNAQQQALGIAGQQIGRVGDALGQGFDLSGQPALQSGVHSGPLSTTLNQTPGQQTAFDTGQGVQGHVAGAGNINTGFSGGNPVQGQVAPGGQIQGQIGNGGQIQNSFNPGQAVQGQVGNQDINQSVNNVTDAYWNQARSRLDPYWNQQFDHQATRLANQGISQNNNTYGNAQQQLGMQRNDAYNTALYGAIGAGANEQNVLFGQQLQQGNFANAAAGQEYNQNLGQANFNNQATQQGLNSNIAQGNFQNAAQAQQYGQNLSSGQFANAAQGQQFGQNQAQAQFGNDAQQQQYGQNSNDMQQANAAAGQQFAQNQSAAGFANNANDTTFQQNLAGQQFGNQAQGQQFNQDLQSAAQTNAARNQGVQEQAYAQNLPLNQFNSLMSSSQVQAPTGINYTPSAVGQTDVTGAYALNQQAQQAAYQAQLQQQQSNLGGLFSLGSAGLMALSDARFKRNVVRIGMRNGHNLYRFQYLWDDQPKVGVMAQEVMHVPGAVHDVGGVLMVDYGAL